MFKRHESTIHRNQNLFMDSNHREIKNGNKIYFEKSESEESSESGISHESEEFKSNNNPGSSLD